MPPEVSPAPLMDICGLTLVVCTSLPPEDAVLRVNEERPCPIPGWIWRYVPEDQLETVGGDSEDPRRCTCWPTSNRRVVLRAEPMELMEEPTDE